MSLCDAAISMLSTQLMILPTAHTRALPTHMHISPAFALKTSSYFLHLRPALKQKHISLWVGTIDWPLDASAPHLQSAVLFNLGYAIYWFAD